ncbi:MAG: UpxY family transcription antiterminator [Flammeovirgaceae bacterium]
MKSHDKHWYAIYTKSRSEKKVAERLEKQGIEVYCPTYTTLRQWSDRKKKVIIPVFSSYVFVRVTEKERYQVLQDVGVMNFIFWLGKPAVIKDKEMDHLKTFLGEYKDSSLTVKALEPGDLVTLQQGAFAGEKGKVEKVGNRKVYILLESIGLVVEAAIAAME